MKYGLDISPAGPWGRPDQIADLASLAERSGWDGVFCEDYLNFPRFDSRPDEPVDTYDVWITLALVAQATSRLTLGTMVTPLPERGVPEVAVQALTVDHLSGGRFVFGAGLGDPASTVCPVDGSDSFGVRAAQLDESLAVLARLWAGEVVTVQGRPGLHLRAAQMRPAPVARPRLPIWIGGALTKPGPRRRALRWDGACLYRVPPDTGWQDVTPDDVRRLRVDAQNRPDAGQGFTIAVGGRERSDDVSADRRYVAALDAAGADWWHEYIPPWFGEGDARRLITAGPIRA